jgi:hypothetical protein
MYRASLILLTVPSGGCQYLLKLVKAKLLTNSVVLVTFYELMVLIYIPVLNNWQRKINIQKTEFWK